MNSCKVLNKDSFIDELITICDECATLDLKQGALLLEKKVKELIENARTTSDPEQQLSFLNEALGEFYNNPNDDYGQFLSIMLPFETKTALFNVNYDNTLAEDKTFSSTFEEKAKASRKQRQKNFLSSKFKEAPNAKLYFQRSILTDIVETFFVKRSGDNPRIFESQEEMNENVRLYKQELLDRVFEYFEGNSLLKSKVANLPRKMYTKQGDYTGVIETVKRIFDNYLSSEAFQSGKLKSLEEFYKEYRDGRPDVRKNAERFLNAYNAWLMLTNFDTLVRDTIGSTVEIKDDSNYDRHTGDLTKYKIRGKATNIWSNWTNSDDITDMSEVISDVTQYLINTSRMYKWGSNEAYPDRYVSFHDFNYTLGLIKKQVFDSKSNTLVLRNLEGIDKVSLHTKKLMLEMLQWNRINETGDVIDNPDGSKTVIPKEVTWKQLISRINENPQKYLHAAFDILCNTNILDDFPLNTYEKSLIWSFYKELFGGDQNPRSLFNLHNQTSKDGIYQIITQVAASTFPEDYLQYYEKNNGSIGTRLLKDFALDNIKRNLLDNIQQTGAVLSDVQYKKFGVTHTSRDNTNDSYLQEVKIKIQTTSGDIFGISANNQKVYVQFDANRAVEIWNAPEIRQLFREILGINFDADPDLHNAYLEQVGHPYSGLNNLGQLIGRALYTSVVNTKYVPKHPNATTHESALKTFLKNQYGEALAKEYNKGIKYDTGYISVLPVNVKDSALNDLAMAVAINSNILAQAQSKTGEGTALANYTLSRMRNFFQNQIEMQCKRVNSALKDMTFVVNDNNLFEGILSRRELKTLKSNQQSTKFSDQDSFALSFVNDFIASFVPNPDSDSYIKNGRVSFLPTVNSDKTQIDGLLVNLNAKTRISNGRGGFKTYLELTDADIEQEMVSEFKPMYDKIIVNINKELLKVYQILPESIKSKYPLIDQGDVISNNVQILNAINQAYASDTSLGKNAKKRILNGLHRDITKYNKTHGRNPIMLAPNIHYTFNSDTGLLEGNHTLQALWGRFNSEMSAATRAKLIQMYADEKDYLAYMERNGLSDPLNVQSFFKYKEHLTIENLLKMKFNIKLFGSDSVVRHDSKEIQFLRGEATFTEQQLRDPKYHHLQSLNLEMKNWINYDNGTMILAKGVVNGVETNITTLNQLRQATNLRIHPMLSKLNRLDYLCSQQYTIATVGSHYAHSGGAGGGSVLVEEAKRWLASNKRNVAATSTVHLFQNKQLDGSPSVYNVAIIEDVTFDLYNVMGDLYKEGHKPLDGGMMVSAFVPDLENNSLAGEKAGLDKKQFGTFFSELYGAGGIVKTAGFAGTNARMRRQKAWQNIQKAMSNKPWTKEFPDENDVDILEVIDITKDYFDNPIDYRSAIKGQQIMYKRPAHDKPSELAAYRLHNIESLGNNQYKIWEIEIDQYGAEIGGPVPRIENGSDIITINNNWDLYTKVFGGFNSLEIGSDNRLTWSENSVKLMVHAMNNVGYRKNNANLMSDAKTEFGQEVADQLKQHNDNVKTGLDQDDIWQPLKYSEIHYMPNIGAIKSLQFNVNPDGDAVYEGRAEINHMVMRLAQLGIQLDKEHHADASDVSMPTQIIQATANRSFTSEYTREIYKALNTLTRQVTKPFIEGIKDIITSNDPTALVEEVSNLLVEKLLSKKDDESSVTSILQDILQKAEEGKTLKFAEDLKGKIPWSDPTISNKLFSELSTTLTNLAVKMKFAGTLSVICPTDRIEKIYGDRLLNSFTQIFDEKTGSTRTKLTKNNIIEYQQSVRDGKEIDSDGRNMLVYDTTRDIQRNVLSQVSNLKTQHNYIIEFENGPSEQITINTPEDYYRVKNLVLKGKKINYTTPIIWAHPAIGKTYSVENGAFSSQIIDWDVEFNRRRDNWIATKTKTLLNSQEFKAARNDYMINWNKHPDYVSFIKQEWERVKQKANNENKILVASPHMLLQLFPQDFNKVLTMSSNDFVARNVARGANNEENSIKWKQGIDGTIQSVISDPNNNLEVMLIGPNDYLENLLLNGSLQTELSQLADNELVKNHNIPVTKIYEDVETGRALSAYNVRYTDVNTGNRFQIYDLDSINLLFKLNNLMTEKEIKGYELFTQLNEDKQQQIFNQIFNSNVFKEIVTPFYHILSKKYNQIPNFDSNFIFNLKMMYPEQFANFINDFYTILKPFVYNYMQTDLKKLSKNYDKADRKVYANGTLIEPVDIETDAYELIMPKIYKTQFGLQEFDDLQTILRDKDFFVKRGLQRFQCKLDHGSYDYELKNFNGEHYYILDKKQGIPDHIAQNIQQIWTDTRKKKHYRVDSDGNVIYEMSSKDDVVCKLGNVQIIVTDNPLFYVQNLNYNTLKVSPERVTEESYQNLIETLSASKRVNSKNFLKAISNPDESYFDLKTFKEFNIAIDKLDYATVKLGDRNEKDFKSVAQLCRIILQNGRELHTAFNESLNLIAGRIPAQSQQSFMTQRVIGFDNADLNTAMVSTFQLFLQGSDLDIDAVTLLGYEFDKNGKFVAWSPYFKSDSKENLEASKDIPLPTGEIKEIYADLKAHDNFFETYDQYFGTIFKTIPLPTGGIKTINGVPELTLDLESPDNLKLFAQFLRDFNEKGINIKGPVNENGVIDINGNVDFYKAPDITLEDGTIVQRSWNLFTSFKQGGSIGARPEQTYAMAEQLLQIANTHNNYLNIAEEHLRDKMSKNYIVHYIYKVSEAPCNQTEAQLGIDQATYDVKQAAKKSAMATASDSFAPGGYETKHKSVGEGQVGKSCVGIGAVAIKANSTTQFYLSELWNHGSDWDKEKILFKHPIYINGKSYYGFANMYTSKEFSQQEIKNFEHALNILNSLEDPSQITQDVAVNIASLLSIAVDNAKDLALKKINSGPRLMGLYAYGMTLGIPVNELVAIMNSPQGLVIAEMTEGSVYNNDPSSFKVIDIFSKLDGYIAGDLERFAVIARGVNNKPIKKMFRPTNGNTKQQLEFGKTTDTIFALLYDAYANWFDTDEALKMEKIKNPKFQIASNLSEMLHQLIQYNAFSKIYERSLTSATYQSYTQFLSSITDPTTQNNYKASIGQMIEYIKDIEQKAELFRRGRGRDLRTLAEGAEEMRILGSILSINKGLKPSTVEAEAFIDTIENLIYDRKKVLGYRVSEKDKIDFFKFMTDKEYQKDVVNMYEDVKHSVNIPHLLLKAPHFNGYLETQMIPLAFFTSTSIKHRIVHKYRKNVEADYDSTSEKPVGLFDLLGLESKSDKENALKGLESLIHFKLFTRWAYDKQLKFTVPKNFQFFTKKGTLAFDPNKEQQLLLCTEAGLASFKKYMEEVYIPQLQADPILSTNEFIKNLDKISFDKTALHNSVTTYSLTGDLMAKSGRQGELNAKMFADFKVLSTIQFQPENGIPSLADAFYLYAQYVYMGKKGTRSLMNAFDSVKNPLKTSFNEHIALMDSEGHLSCSKEELILWCAPVGTQQSSSTYAYVNLGGQFGKSLGIKIQTNLRLDEDQQAMYEQAREDNEEEGHVQRRKENYGVYRPEYLATAYNRLTRNHFLVPSTTDKVAFTETVPLHGDLENGHVTLEIKQDMVFDCKFNTNLENTIEAKIKDGTVTKFKSVEDFRQTLKTTLKSLHIPYKTTLTSDKRQQIDLGVIETIINHLLNC